MGFWALGVKWYPDMKRVVLLLVFLLPFAVAGQGPAPIAYRISLPEPEHRWMQVEATFPDLPPQPLQLRMSRSSPGRYARHEFAKNVFDVKVTDAAGAALPVAQAAPNGWDVAKHPGAVRVTYRIFGDQIDGTYLSIDATHAHMNMPATLMWARGLDERPVTVQFVSPAGREWRVASQLFPASAETPAGKPGAVMMFTAPNLQYLMDSPTEFGGFSLRTFQVPGGATTPTFRFALHHTGTDAELDAYVKDVERVVREHRNVFGEYPAFEGNTYTFIADYLPWAEGDAMEHRNSTILTSASSIRNNRLGLLGSVSHEFFHVWNVERIRPRSLEPFNFEDANMSGELWFAEGFTNYYEPLTLVRAGLMTLDEFTAGMANTINIVTLAPGRAIRTAEEMSRFAPFVDDATSIDPTSFTNTYISYYTWGEAIGLGLDLALRDRSNGKVTLDRFMRAMWEKYGKPGGRRPGYVDNPYTIADLKNMLATVSGDAKFADEFFARYIQGHDVVEYARLLERAGLVLRPSSPSEGYAGEITLRDIQGRPRVGEYVPFGSPAYAAGLDKDDVVLSIGGTNVSSTGDVASAIRRGRPGDSLSIVLERRGQRVSSTLKLIADPRVELVAGERIGRMPTAAQRAFRNQWLSSASGNTF